MILFVLGLQTFYSHPLIFLFYQHEMLVQRLPDVLQTGDLL